MGLQCKVILTKFNIETVMQISDFLYVSLMLFCRLKTSLIYIYIYVYIHIYIHGT